MQSQVAERDYREQSSNAEPVHGHGGVSLDALAGLASALELQQGTTRGGVWSLTGFDELEALEVAALEFMLVDSSSLDSGRAWSRPADKLSARPQDGQSKLGFESLNGGPVAFEDSERVLTSRRFSSYLILGSMKNSHTAKSKNASMMSRFGSSLDLPAIRAEATAIEVTRAVPITAYRARVGRMTFILPIIPAK